VSTHTILTQLPSTLPLTELTSIHPVSDHVFVSPPWSARGGEPYSVARILAFVNPQPQPKQPKSRKSVSTTSTPEPDPDSLVPRVRVHYYLRPRDLTHLPTTNHRLLIATMVADLVPLSYIRGVCTVRHRDQIADLHTYRKKADAFWFHQVSGLDPTLACPSPAGGGTPVTKVLTARLGVCSCTTGIYTGTST
jgi:hypothetical protein